MIDAIPPAGGAVVMGSGIVSVALLLDGHRDLSYVPLIVAALAWVALGLLLGERALHNRPRFRSEASSPTSLTAVAGSGVLGVRLSQLGWQWTSVALLAVALALWLWLLRYVLRAWTVPTIGASFIVVVATESLALLSAVVALSEQAPWLLYAAFAPFLLGLAFYLFVLIRFDRRQLAVGEGDHWVTGGALAISTVAAGRIVLAASGLHVLDWLGGTLRGVSLALWTAALVWLPVLLISEVAHRRPDYNVRRWSTVFPVGMYAACSFVVADAAKVNAIGDFARVWVWVAVTVWLVVLAGMLRHGARLARGAVQEARPDARIPSAPAQVAADGRQRRLLH